MGFADSLLGLWPSVDRATRLAKRGHPYTELDPNFYNNWLGHLHQELRTLRKILDRKGAKAAEEYARGWHSGSGAKPDRSTHSHGTKYLDWVAELANDRGFPARFKRAMAMKSKLAEEIGEIIEFDWKAAAAQQKKMRGDVEKRLGKRIKTIHHDRLKVGDRIHYGAHVVTIKAIKKDPDGTRWTLSGTGGGPIITQLGLDSRYLGLAEGVSPIAEEIEGVMAGGLTEGVPSFTAAQEAARRLFKKIKPGSNRTKTIQGIAYAVTRDTWLMDWFASFEGGPNYNNVGDVLGGVIYQWKEDWQLTDRVDYEDLSVDPYLTKSIAAAAKKHRSKNASLGGINWTNVDHLVSGIQNSVRRAQDGNAGSLKALRKAVNDLQREVKK